MALAETARLVVQMDLAGNFAGAIKSAEADVGKFAATAGNVAVANVGKLEKGFSALGGALGHAKSQIGGLLTGPLGILGLGAGIFTLAGAIDTGINKAADMGLEVSKLTALTGDSAESMSALAAAFEHFNISSEGAIKAVGMLEKNVGLLAAKKDGLANFQKTFGLALTDSSGHLKDANALILTAADYFNNRLIPATTKAAALSKLFGRAWVELIPLLQQGSQGILDAEAAAKDLGLTLTQANVNDLAKFKASTRELGTAIGGLELQIGLALVPALKDLADAAERFIAQNRGGIVQFFKDAAKNAQGFGAFIEHSVLPPLKALATGLMTAWNSIPDGLKSLLVGGFVANKAIKWTFGIDIAGGIGNAISSALGKGLVSSLAASGIGKAFVQPVFVTNPGFGGVNPSNLVPAAAGAGGAAEVLGASAGVAGVSSLVGPLAIALVAAVGAPLLVAGVLKALGLGTQKSMSDQQAAASQGRGKGGGNDPLFVSSFAPVNNAAANVVRHNMSEVADAAMGAAQHLQDVKDASQGTAAQIRAMAAASIHLTGWFAESAKQLKDEIAKRSAAKYGGSGLGSAAVDATFRRDILRRAEGIAKTGIASAEHLAKLKALEAQAVAGKDYGVAHKVAALEATLKAKKLSVHIGATTINVSTKVSANSVTLQAQRTRRYGPTVIT